MGISEQPAKQEDGWEEDNDIDLMEFDEVKI
jgi:hypothetical protein